MTFLKSFFLFILLWGTIAVSAQNSWEKCGQVQADSLLHVFYKSSQWYIFPDV